MSQSEMGYQHNPPNYPHKSSGYEYNPSPPPAPPIAAGSAYRAGCRTLFARALTWGAFAAVILAALGALGAVAIYFSLAGTLPPAEQLAAVEINQSTKIYDRTGGLLFEVFDAEGGRRTIITPDKIPPVLKQATLATEDPSFETNPGVDWYGVLRAIYYLARYHRAIVGGSTITQQLIKNTLLTPEQTIERKIREAILAVEVTRRYNKDEILAFYMNTIYYGNLSYGIQAAAQSYFKKDVGQLNLAEASLLAGLPQAPSLYDPCVNPDAALERQKIVLDLMVKEKYIQPAQADAAAEEMDKRLHADDFAANCARGNAIAAPHFVEYVRTKLEEEYGPEVVYKGGLQVYTTLDPTLQKIVEEEARKQIAAIKKQNVSSAAVVATNPQTGEIYAMLGSVDFFDKSIDGQVNVATRLRQPGSSIKPLNYVTALQKGWSAATPLLDIRTEFPNGALPPYVPVNYDGKEHGIVNLRAALANSLNIPAVKTLYFVGVKEMIATAEKMGITTFRDPNRYGLSLTLGGGEVKLVEHTGAYAVFANAGNRVPLTPYRKILDGRGQTLLDGDKNKPIPQKVLDPRHAYLITSILSEDAARALAFGANSPLKISRPAAVKTGTTNDFKDNWTLGYTPELVVGVWVGNPRNEPMKGVTGISGAAPIWHQVMERVYKEDDAFKNIAPHEFPVPAGLVRATVCNESGLLPTDVCPNDHRHSEIFLAEQAPRATDNLWVKVKVDKTNGLVANDNCPADQIEERVFMKMPQDVILPYDKVVAWGNAHGIPQPPTASSPCAVQPIPPTPPPPEPTADLVKEVNLDQPRDGETVKGVVTVRGSASAPNFAGYVVEFGKGPLWLPLGGGAQPVVRGTLVSFDSREIPDGDIIIRLTVFDRAGNRFQDQVRVVIDNQPQVTATPRPTRTPRATRTPTPPATLKKTPTPKPTSALPLPTLLP